jgi:hypothetical protein
LLEYSVEESLIKRVSAGIVWWVVAFMCAGCATAYKGASARAPDDARTVQGNWKPAMTDLAGRPLADAVVKVISLRLDNGKTLPAVYERTGDTLRICHDLSGTNRSTEFTSIAGTRLSLVTSLRKPEEIAPLHEQRTITSRCE